MHHRLMITALVAALAVGGCGRQAEPPPPVPTTDDAEAQRRAAEEEARIRAAEAEALRLAEEEARMAREAAERAMNLITERIHFGYDQFNITPEAEAILRDKAEVLRANGEVRLRIEGHADERGSNEYNLALGMRRATAARQFLTGYGLQGARFEVVSFGEERPLDPRSNETAWTLNRRAEFVVTAGGDNVMLPDGLR